MQSELDKTKNLADVETDLSEKDEDLQAMRDQLKTLTAALYNAGIFTKD